VAVSYFLKPVVGFSPRLAGTETAASNSSQRTGAAARELLNP
jgi:hypothetical protein